MAPLDNPLKILILSFRRAFAEWLLGEAVQQVQPLNVELPASARRSDLLFEVIQADGQRVLLHIEHQGRRSHEPMAWRMLDYMSRLLKREVGDQAPDGSVRLHSVVIYTGVGAGLNDRGKYEVLGVDGVSRLSWRYERLLLWQLEAEALLGLNEPAFLPLVGQARLEEPERVLPEVVARIRQVGDEVERGRLLTALASLMSSEEVLAMVEKMLEAEEELLDTPYLRRIREQGRAEGLSEGKELGLTEGAAKGKAEGLSEGKELGLVEGIAKGKEEGLEVGLVTGLREAILEAIALRFNPSALDYRQISQQLEVIPGRKRLQQLHAAAIQAEDLAAFVACLQEE